MLIQSRSEKWIQDPGVADMIDHFDEVERKWLAIPEKKRGHLTDHLSQREVETIAREVVRCRDDFSYCARNYFWIVTKKERKDVLFSLFESQELILDYMRRMKEKGLSQRLMLIKARQLGCSTLIEGLMAHKAFFFRNTEGFIVSFDDDATSNLFGIVQHIYNKLPWWLKPERANIEVKRTLFLENPDPDQRRQYPGMNSRVTARGAEGRLGIGQGRTLVAFHGSEWCDWAEDRAIEIIEEDVQNALAEGPHTFGVLESSAKGAGTYSHDFWLRMERLEERAEWQPVFLPWFFDRSRTIVDMPPNWKIAQEEEDMRSRAHADWVRCDNPACEMYHRRVMNMKHYVDTPCRFCGSGVFRDFYLSDAQCRWMEWHRQQVQGNEKSMNKLKQEQATTADEAFRLTGVRLFSEQAVAYAIKSIMDPVAKGFVDKTLRFHGVNHATGKCWCSGCELDHSYDDDTLSVWEFPRPDAEYVVAGDTADGLGGEHDYLVAQVLRINKSGGPDALVASYARNDILPAEFAGILNFLGRYYNVAVLAPETNAENGGAVITVLRSILNYPNIYRPMNPLNLTMETSQVGWKTTPGTKPNIYNALRAGLQARNIEIRCKFTVQELQNFRKDEVRATKMRAVAGHDDRIMALMIAYFVAHEKDWDPEGGTMRFRAPLTLENAPVTYQCLGCGNRWPAKSVAMRGQCPECRCMHVTAATRTQAVDVSVPTRISEIFSIANSDAASQMEMPDYDSL